MEHTAANDGMMGYPYEDSMAEFARIGAGSAATGAWFSW
jgi:hypothetical protein